MRRKMFLRYIAIILIIFASEICLALDPSQDLGEKAAALANEVLGVPYLSGGQGWDLKDNKFVESKDIIEGYNYYDSATQLIKKGRGLDCSGLVYWAYNKAYGVNSKDIKRGKSGECLNCPIGWFTADGIGYETDKTKFISHIPEKKIDEKGKYLPIHTEPPEESALKPGDLLFLDTKIETAGCPSPGFGCIDHVGMYVGDVGGNGYVIHASGDNLIEIEPKGSTGTKVGGPIKSADGGKWYNINYKDGTVGWSTESQLKFSSTNTNEIETIVDAKVRFTPGKKSEVTKLKYNQWLNLKVDGEKTYRDYFAGYGRVIENLAVSAATIGIPPTINQDSLKQLRQNGDAVTIGEKLTDTTVAFRAELSNSYKKMIKLQVELRRLDEYEHNFLDSEGHESDFKNSEFVTSGSEAIAYAYGLIDGDYHWRARAVNEDEIASEWVDFGGNDISEADFTVSATQTPESITPKTLMAVVSSESGSSSVSNPSTRLKLFKLNDSSYVNSVAFSPDGSKLAAASQYNTYIWDVTSENLLEQLSDGYSIAFNPDSSKIATGGGGDPCIWDVASGQKLLKLNYNKYVYSIAFSPDGSKISMGNYDNIPGGASIFDAATGDLLLEVNNGIWDGGVMSLAFSPDGSKIATAGFDDTRIWDVTSGGKLLELHPAGFPVAFSPDGSKIATSSDGNSDTVLIWDLASGEKVLELSPARSSVAFSPDGSKIAAGSNDDIVRIWDVATGDEL